MKRLHPTELCLKGENLTSLYKNAVKSFDFTAFWYARHDFPLRGINFSSCRMIKISTPVGADIFMVRPTRFAPPGHKLRTVSGNKNAHPGGVDIFMVRPTRFERATYRVGVFRRILIKCCIFKDCTVFDEIPRLF